MYNNDCLLSWKEKKKSLVLLFENRKKYPIFFFAFYQTFKYKTILCSFAIFFNFRLEKIFCKSFEKFHCFCNFFLKIEVFNGKFIIYAFCTLFFHMNNCSECKKENVGIFILLLWRKFFERCLWKCSLKRLVLQQLFFIAIIYLWNSFSPCIVYRTVRKFLIFV